MRQERLRPVYDAPEVDVHHALDLLERHVLDVAAERDPGVVDHDVDDAELGRDGVGVGKHGVAVGDVEALLVHGGADDARVPRGLAQADDVDVAQRELRAAAGQVVGQRPSDTRSRAGNDRNLPGRCVVMRRRAPSVVGDAVFARGGLVGLPVELAGHRAEPEREARPQRRVVAVRVQVPARAATGRPDRASSSGPATSRCTRAADPREPRRWPARSGPSRRARCRGS